MSDMLNMAGAMVFKALGVWTPPFRPPPRPPRFLFLHQASDLWTGYLACSSRQTRVYERLLELSIVAVSALCPEMRC